ncbi:biosynthetic arginine decarboxylase [Motiliproteus sp. MSK22-1]|uniref:biosynthetic arginine decarboxylase n=1 Tax=Motiliproteus sp. MSK22-1 TaxID=1897630 RepID=UPI0009755824|nr:biosynthetic arginine decarboxylase [Motiliproteus sp. MSK22-1]OMH31837.1 arginine decarboxylase [Motiliproteus sp. MSK22-1]
MNTDIETPWTTEDSAQLYGIREWGAGYFDLSEQGDVTVNIRFDSGDVRVSLVEILSGIRERGVPLPVILRIENLLDSQLALLNESFNQAISACEYKGSYRGVFPVKVNQQCQVIEELAQFGERYNHGLEAGSKAELIIALSSLKPDGRLIICNGYKDEEFIDLALRAQRLGYHCVFVIETPTELPIIIERSKALNIKPKIGVRVKLSSKVTGLWNDTSGDRSIFGLTSNQLVDVLDRLKEHQMLDCLELLHYHLGSQIPNIRDIRNGVMEACRYYVNLVKEGASMGYLDLGGGLAVDYVGSKSCHVHSKNYSLDEYCTDVVEVVKSTLDAHEIAHPTIVTESGRATVAYSSMLLFNVLDVTHFEPAPLPKPFPVEVHELIGNLHEVLGSISPTDLQQCYNDAIYYREEIGELFKRGQIDLRDRSLAENVFLEILQRIKTELEQCQRIPHELEGLKEYLADIYYGNFSVFQSLPDIWAIDQVFPVMPLHRHREKPCREAIVADITCDCDGKIDNFIDTENQDVRSTLPLHPLKDDEDYVLGVFLVGAYQETLGDLHNLFGDTAVASVRISEDGSFDLVKELAGDSISDVLSYVEYQPQSILENFRRTAEKAVRQGTISAVERRELLDSFSDSLRGYTYYES